MLSLNPVLKLYNQSVIQPQDNWSIVCTLLTPPLLNDVIEFFLYTRSYQEGLDFFDWCYSVVENTPNKESTKEAFVHDTIFTVRLVLFDKLNMWERYIREYDAFVPMQASTIKDESKYHTIHKKLDRMHQGKNTEHLKCHQRYELTDEELQTRYDYLKRRMQKHLGGN